DVFADNYVLSEARARSAAEYIAAGLGLPKSGLMIEGRGPDDPIAANETAEGRQQNRRVELVLAGMRPGRQSFLDVPSASSGVLVAETRGASPAAVARQAQLLDENALEAHLEPPIQVEPSITSLSPGIGWVLPVDGYRPSIPALQISIKHAPNQTVALFANGLEVDPVQFVGKETSDSGALTVSRWAGVPLLEGANQLVADIIDADGLVADRLTRIVHFAGNPVRAEFDGEASLLLADGKTRPVIAVRMFDRFGQPARHSSIGGFTVDAPYRSWWSVQDERQNKLVQISRREPLFTVGDNGLAYLELEPTTTSGEVTIRMNLENQREQEIKAWLKPQAREWILVGFGEGTVGYNTISRNATAAGVEDGYFDDGRLAFFAKGSIKGEYLLTLAYDSARDRQQTRNGFATEIDPTAYYTLYGDNTEQRFEAASQRKLYVKLERGQFNALFGDFNSGLNTAELSRYERRMNGLRSEFAGQNYSYKVFASESDQVFVRDEIRGDGTSGLYRLSQGPIVALSESIRIETRDRFDQAEVLESRALSRFLDYNLDPLDGTVFFKQPIPSRDESLNPLYIIAEYEVRGGGGDELTAGGRVAVHNKARTLEVGVTAISEDQQLRGGELLGADLRWQATDSTLVRAEVATSERDTTAGSESGDAQLVVVEHRSEKLDLRAEYRETEQQYGLGLQSAAESGIRKIELDARYAVTSEVTVQTEIGRQDNLESGADRISAQADLQYQTNTLSANVGYLFAEDTFADGEERSSNVIDAGISRRLFDSSLSVRANGSLSLDGDAENADYPARYIFGVDYEILPEVNVYLEYENAEGRDLDAEMTRVGVRASPWSRANFTSSISNEMTEFGPRLYANVGLVQGFQLGERWVFDVGVDQSDTLRDPGLRVFDEDRDLASGSLSDDFTAGYVGALYQSDDWSVNTRLEHRHADREARTSFLSGWFREPSLGHGLSAGLTLFSNERDDGAEALAAEFRFGWARRPATSPWTLFHQVDLGIEERTTASTEDSSWRIVSNLNLNRRLSANSQLSLQYAAKFVRSDFDEFSIDGYTDLLGVDYRRGFADRWEVSAQASVYQSHRAGTVDYGTGLALGYGLTDDMWLSVGYNLSGFSDDDFAAARYTASGPFLRISLRGHQALLRRVTGR
ncbi:MAG: OmpA family protein, partial [Pseudomonadota bacterium]